MGVQPICRVLTEHGCKIAPSTYYAFTTRAPSARSVCDEARLVQVRRVFAASGNRYGADKVWWQLHKEGSVVARCTVKRLMKGAGLQGVVRRHGHIRTTTADPDAVRAPDLVKRNFTASRPNELWVVDFTYVHTFIGFVFTAFVTDVFSRRLVGWRTFSSMPTELPLDALEMAVWIRAGHDLTGLVHHSDAGSQYTSFRYTDRLAQLGVLASIGSVGDSFDNALAESTIGLYKSEVIHHQGPWRGANDVELATAIWLVQHRAAARLDRADHAGRVREQLAGNTTEPDRPVRHRRRAGGRMTPESPPRDDERDDAPTDLPATLRRRCPTCSALFSPSGRQAYCTPACRQKAYRERRTTSDLQTLIPTPSRRGRRDVSVYQCPDCDQPYLGQQWCPDCQRPCLPLGYGGNCPYCMLTELPGVF